MADPNVTDHRTHDGAGVMNCPVSIVLTACRHDRRSLQLVNRPSGWQEVRRLPGKSQARAGKLLLAWTDSANRPVARGGKQEPEEVPEASRPAPA